MNRKALPRPAGPSKVPPFPYGPSPVDIEPATVELALLDLYPPVPPPARRATGFRGHLRAATQSALTTAGVIGVLGAGFLCARGGVVLLELTGALS